MAFAKAKVMCIAKRNYWKTDNYRARVEADGRPRNITEPIHAVNC